MGINVKRQKPMTTITAAATRTTNDHHQQPGQITKHNTQENAEELLDIYVRKKAGWLIND